MSKKVKIIIAIAACAVVLAAAIPLVIFGVKKSSNKGKRVETISLENCELVDNIYNKNVNVGDRFTISYVVSPAEAKNKNVKVEIYKTSVVSSAFDVVTNEVGGEITFTARDSQDSTLIKITSADSSKVTATLKVTVHKPATILSVPTFIENPFDNDRTITWNPVSTNTEGAVVENYDVRYKVIAENVTNGTTFEKEVETNSFTFDAIGEYSLVKGCQYNIKVVAVGNDYIYKNSEASSEFSFIKLDDIKNVIIRDGVISFDKVNNAQSYVVEYSEGKNVYITTNTYNFNSLNLDKYDLRVYARRSNISGASTKEYETMDVSGKQVFVYDGDFTTTHTINRLNSVTNVILDNLKSDNFEILGINTNGKINSYLKWEIANFEDIKNYIYFELTFHSVGSNKTVTKTTEELTYKVDKDLLNELGVNYNQTVEVEIKANIKEEYKSQFISSSEIATTNLYYDDFSAITSQLLNNKLILNINSADVSKIGSLQLLFINNGNVEVKDITETTIDLTEIVKNAGEYEVYLGVVGAVGKNGSYINTILESEPISQFKKLSVINIDTLRVEESKNITFNGIEGISNYKLTFFNADETEVVGTLTLTAALKSGSTDEYTIDLTDVNTIGVSTTIGEIIKNGELQEGEFALKLSAIANSANLIDSAMSESANIVRLSAPEFEDVAIVDNIISWVGEENYTYAISFDDGLTYRNVGTANSFDIDLIKEEISKTTGSVKVKVVATGISGQNDRIIKSMELSQAFSRSVTPTNVKIEKGILSFNEISGATYEIEYNGITKVINTNSYAFEDVTNSDTFSFKLRSLSNSTFASDYTKEYFVQKLAKVTNIKLNDERTSITWDEVENATGYNVIIGSNPIVFVNTNNYNFDSSLEPGSYNVKIVAVGNTDDLTANAEESVAYISSSENTFNAIKMATPTNLAIEDGVVTWDYTESNNIEVSKFVVTLSTDGEDPATREVETRTNFSCVVDDLIANWAGGQDIIISVVAVSNNENAIRSEESITHTTKKLLAPTIAVNENGLISITTDINQPNELDYIVEIYDDENNLLNTINSNAKEFNLSEEELDGASYITIKSTNSEYFTSNSSNQLTITKLNKVSGFSVDNDENKLLFDKVENTSSYSVVIKKSGSVVKQLELNASDDIYTAEEKVYIDIDPSWTSGNYTINILNNGGTGFLTSDEYSNSFIKLVTPQFEATYIKDNVLTWKGESNYQYRIKLDATDVSAGTSYVNVGTSNTYDFNTQTDFADLIANNNSFKVYIQAIAGNSGNEIYSNVFEYTIEKTQTATNLRVENGLFKFDKLQNTTTSLRYGAGDVADVDVQLGNKDNYNFAGLTTNKIYNVKVRQMQDNQIYSEYSSVFYIQKLSSVTYVKSDSTNRDNIIWDNISNATSYSVKFNNSFFNSSALTENTFPFPTKQQGASSGDYIIKVVANGDANKTETTNSTPAYISSDEFESSTITKLQNPTNLKVSNNILTWDYSQANNGGFYLSMLQWNTSVGYTGNVASDARSFDGSTYSKNWNPATGISIQIKAISNNDSYVNGEFVSPSVQAEKLNQAGEIQIVDGVLIWSNANTVGTNYTYTIKLYNEDKTEVIKTITTSRMNESFKDIDFADVDYVTITISCDNHFSSDESAFYKIDKLSAVSNITVDNENKTLKFAKVENAYSYSIAIWDSAHSKSNPNYSNIISNSDATFSVDENIVISLELLNLASSGNTYNVAITVRGDDYQDMVNTIGYISSEEYTSSLIKLPINQVTILSNDVVFNNYSGANRTKVEKFILTLSDGTTTNTFEFVEADATAGRFSLKSKLGDDYIDEISQYNGEVTITLYAVTEQTDTINSEVYSTKVLKLKDVTPQVKNGLLTWEVEDDQVSTINYLIYCYDESDNYLGVYQVSQNFYAFGGIYENTHHVKVQAQANGLFYSEISESVEIVKLNIVNNLQITRNTNSTDVYHDDYYVLTFDQVENATGYKVVIDNAIIAETLTTNSFTIPFDSSYTNGVHKLYVYALGDSTKYINGGNSYNLNYSILATPSIQFPSGVNEIRWNKVLNATKYELILTNTNGDVTTKIVQATSENTYSYAGEGLASGTYNIQIKAIYEGINVYLDSLASSGSQILEGTKLNSVTLENNEGVLIFDNIDNNENIKLYANDRLYSSTEYNLTVGETKTELTFKEDTPGAQFNNVYIVVIRPGKYFDSEKSNIINAVNLSADNIEFARDESGYLTVKPLLQGNEKLKYVVSSEDLEYSTTIYYDSIDSAWKYDIDKIATYSDGLIKIPTPEIAEAGIYEFSVRAIGATIEDAEVSTDYLNSKSKTINLIKANAPKMIDGKNSFYCELENTHDIGLGWASYEMIENELLANISITFYPFNEETQTYETTSDIIINHNINTTQCGFSSDSVLLPGKYRVTLQYKSASNYVLDSNLTVIDEIVKLEAPEVTIVDGVITWQDNGYDYIVKEKFLEEAYSAPEGTVTLQSGYYAYTNPNWLDNNNIYSIRVRAQIENAISSDFGSIIINKIDEVTNFTRNNDGKLEFDGLFDGDTQVRYQISCEELENYNIQIAYDDVTSKWLYEYNGTKEVVYNEESNKFTLEMPEVLSAGEYEFKIRAIGGKFVFNNGTEIIKNYVNSNYSSINIIKYNLVTSSDENFVIQNNQTLYGELGWEEYTAVNNETPAMLQIKLTKAVKGEDDNLTYDTTPTEIILSDYNLNKTFNFSGDEYESGYYKIVFTYLSSNSLHLNSEPVTVYVEKLEAVKPIITNGVINLNVLAGDYDGFTVKDSLNSGNVTIDSTSYENENWVGGATYTVSFACHKDGFISSSMSTSVTVTKLNTINDFAMSYDNLQKFFNWTPETDSEGNYISSRFEIYCLESGKGTSIDTYIIDSGNASQYLITALQTGSYEYRIKAIGDTIDYNSDGVAGYVNSNSSTALYIRFQKDVKDIVIENGLVKWEKLAHTQKYYIEVFVNSSSTNLDIANAADNIATFYTNTNSFDINEIQSVANSEEENFIFRIRAIPEFINTTNLVAISTDEVNNIGRFAKFNVNDLYTDFRVDDGWYSYVINQTTLDKINEYGSNFVGFEEITMDSVKALIENVGEYENKLAFNSASILFNFEMEINGKINTQKAIHTYKEVTDGIRVYLWVVGTGTFDVRLRAIGNSNNIAVEGVEKDDIPVFIRSNFTKMIYSYRPEPPICPVKPNTEIVNNNLMYYPTVGYDKVSIIPGYAIHIKENDDNYSYFYKNLSEDELNNTNDVIIQNILDFYNYDFDNEFKIEENKWYEISLFTLGSDTFYKEDNGVVVEKNDYDILLQGASISCGKFYILGSPELEISNGDIRWQKDQNATAYEMYFGSTSIKLDMLTSKVYIDGAETEDSFVVDKNNYISYSFKDKDYLSGNHMISVRAIGNGSNVLDSVYSSKEVIKLEEVNVKIANGRFEWTNEWDSRLGSEPDSYTYIVELIRVGTNELIYAPIETSDNFYELTDDIPYADSTGQRYSYAVRVYIKGEDTYLNSDSVKSTFAERLDTVGTLQATSYGRIEWVAPSGASDFVDKYQVFDCTDTEEKLIYTSEKVNNFINMSDSKFGAKAYKLKVRAIPKATETKYLNSIFNKTYYVVKYSTPLTTVDDKGLFSWSTDSYEATQHSVAGMRLEINTDYGFIVDGEKSSLYNLIVELDNTHATFDLSSTYKVSEHDSYYIVDPLGTKTLEFETGVNYVITATYKGYTGTLNNNTTEPYYLNSSSTYGTNIVKLDNVNIDESNSDSVVGEELNTIEGYEDYTTYIMFTNKKYDNKSITSYRFEINEKEYFIDITPQENGMYRGEFIENETTKLILLVNPNSTLAGNSVDVCYLIFAEDFVEYGKDYSISIQAVKYGNNYTRSDKEEIKVEVPETPIDLQYTGKGLIVWYGTSSNVRYNVEYSYTTDGTVYNEVKKQVDGNNYVNTTMHNGQEVYVYIARIDEITAKNGIGYIKVNSVSTINSSYTSPYIEITGTTLEHTLFESGNGTIENPYLITDVLQLSNIKYNLSAHYKLNSNILISTAFTAIGIVNPWESQGLDIEVGNAFTGSLDGNGKTITYSGNSFMASTTMSGFNVMSMFYKLGSTATIKNLNIKFNGGTVTLGSNTTYYMSALAYENSGTITNVLINGNLTIKNNYTFYYSFVSYNNGKIENVVNSANITMLEQNISSNNYTDRYLAVSGIVTTNNSNGRIVNSGNKGQLSGSVVGGIATNSYGNISGCYNKGEFTITDYTGRRTSTIYSGGIVTNYNGGEISYCYSNNNVNYNIYTINRLVYIGGLIASTASQSTQERNNLTNSYSVLSISNKTTNNPTNIKRGNIIGCNYILDTISRVYTDTTVNAVADGTKIFKASNITGLTVSSIDSNGNNFTTGSTYPVLKWESSFNSYWGL